MPADACPLWLARLLAEGLPCRTCGTTGRSESLTERYPGTDKPKLEDCPHCTGTAELVRLRELVGRLADHLEFVHGCYGRDNDANPLIDVLAEARAAAGPEA